MEMSERPLMVDVSVHQTYIDLDKAEQAGNKVHAIFMRAGVGLNKDADFDAFDAYYDWDELWRASYYAIYPAYLPKTQVDKWMVTDPDGEAYMLDCERTSEKAPKDVAKCIMDSSDLMLAETGKRPIMYGAYYFLMANLIPFASEEWLNEHWWLLASYGDGDADEDDGWSIMIPDKIDPDKVFAQQTTDKASLYPGGEPVDRDRFLLGGVEELTEWWLDYVYGQAIPVDPPAGEHEHPELVDGIMMLDEAVNSRFNVLETQVNLLLEVNKSLVESLETLRTAFRLHSARQVEQMAEMKTDITLNAGRSHVHKSWWMRRFD